MLVQVYGDNAMKKTAVYKWVKRFSEGRESVTDEKRSRRPATGRTEENIAKVRQIVCENRWLVIRSIAQQVNDDRETVRKLLNWWYWHEEGVCNYGPKGAHRKTKAKKSHNLPRPFGEARRHFGTSHHRRWVYQYDPETKQQSAQWKTANPPQP